nr:LEAF RUST 10 DISEASE-RESISTANCE LOCUS RECEPTOR-LIKE PROTEIN KINASE-like 2.3 [Ipomoea batatas]
MSSQLGTDAEFGCLGVIHGGLDLRAREKGGGVLEIQHFSAELFGLGVDEGQLVGEILRENRLRYSHADISDADDGDFGVTLGRRRRRRVLASLLATDGSVADKWRETAAPRSTVATTA